MRYSRRRRIVAGISPYQWPRGVEYRDDDAPGGRAQRVVHDQPIGRVLSARLFRRQRRVGVGAPTHAIGERGREEVNRVALSLSKGGIPSELAQRLDVVENPKSAPVRGDVHV